MKAILQKLYGNNKRSKSVKAELREVKLNKFEETTNTVAEIGQQVVQVGFDLSSAAELVDTSKDKLEELLALLQGQKTDIDAYVGFEETYGFGLNVDELVGSYEGLEETITMVNEKLSETFNLLLQTQNNLAK